MRKLMVLWLLCLLCQGMLVAQDANPTKPLLVTYMEDHPQTVRTRFINDGCSLSLSADSSNMFVQLYITNPMLQMRLLMQECFFFIDPTGNKKEKYALILPSAKYVQNYAGSAMPRPTSSDARPDLSGLLTMLNLYGAEWDINGRITQLHSDRFRVVFDTIEEALIYTALVPREALSKEKKSADIWSFGFYSPIDGGTPPPNGPMPNRNGGPGRAPNGRPQGDDAKLQAFLSKAIQQWTTIPIKEIEDINNPDKSDGEHGWKGAASNYNLEAVLAVSGDTLSIGLTSDNPVTQFGFIMQGLCLTLSNSSNDSISIAFPSAFDVKDKMVHHPDSEINRYQYQAFRSRPDVRYLLSELNDTTLTITGTVDATAIGYDISADPDSGQVSYQVQLLAKGFTIGDPILVSVSSIPSEAMSQNPEFESEGEKPAMPMNHGQYGNDDRSHAIQETIVIHIPDAQF